MIKIGFIGYGSMGSMLMNAFIKSGRIRPDEIIVSTKTKSKLAEIKKRWENIHIAENNSEAARAAKYLFICVKPLEIKNILSEISINIEPGTHIISIAGSVSIKMIEHLTPAKVTRLIPGLTSEVLEGISLVCHSDRVTQQEADFVETLLAGISEVKKIKEEDFELTPVLTSCMPGFVASIFKELIDASTGYNSNLSKSEMELMVMNTLYGTIKLLKESNMTFEEMIQRAATKGGVTEEGIKVFQKDLPNTFNEMYRVILEKRKAVKKQIEAHF